MSWRSSTGAATQRLILVDAPTDVAEARRQGQDVAAQAGLGEQPAAELALAITEAASNIVKHARSGMVLLRQLPERAQSTIEVLALDKGTGMADVRRSMRDGYSTAGTPGNGLGALSRLTRSLEIYSRSGIGTALRFEVRSCSRSVDAEGELKTGAVCLPKPGEIACGDAWAVMDDGTRAAFLVVDGLGHGPDAAVAAHAALASMRRQGNDASASAVLAQVHEALKGTRGAAGAVAVVDLARSSGSFCGIGNIGFLVRNRRESRQLLSHNGILGHLTRTRHEFAFDFPPGASLIAHSDGVGTHWRLEDYPGLERHHPSLIAAMLYRDHCRGRDDATCVALSRASATQ